jgi:hypothetical protein
VPNFSRKEIKRVRICANLVWKQGLDWEHSQKVVKVARWLFGETDQKDWQKRERCENIFKQQK